MQVSDGEEEKQVTINDNNNNVEQQYIDAINQFYKDLFNHYDKNKTGFISGKDLKPIVDSSNIRNTIKAGIYCEVFKNDRLRD